jgi:hypothetical protein
VWDRRSLGVCGKGTSTKAAWGPPAGYGNSCGVRLERRSLAMEGSNTFRKYTQNVSNSTNAIILAKGSAVRHLQNCISCLDPDQKFLTFCARDKHKIVKKGNSAIPPAVAVEEITNKNQCINSFTLRYGQRPVTTGCGPQSSVPPRRRGTGHAQRAAFRGPRRERGLLRVSAPIPC